MSAMKTVQQELGLGPVVSGGDGVRRVRCISLWQPWASLMACGAKYLETRSWGTNVRGEVFIHAAATNKGIASLSDAPLDQIEAMELAVGLKMGRWRHELPFGAVIGRGCLFQSSHAGQAVVDHPDQKHFGDFTVGRFAHHYRQLEAIESIPWAGMQGFFFAELKVGELELKAGGQECPPSLVGEEPVA